MNWENLKEFKCPYCEQPLAQEDKTISCTTCIFSMSVEKYRDVMMHRGGTRTSTVRNNWQNLHDDKCIQCNSPLVNAKGSFEALKCSNGQCTFRIKGETIAKILTDPEHSANRFH